MVDSDTICFDLFSTQAEADRAAAAITDSRPDWWAVSTHLLGPFQSN